MKIGQKSTFLEPIKKSSPNIFLYYISFFTPYIQQLRVDLSNQMNDFKLMKSTNMLAANQILVGLNPSSATSNGNEKLPVSLKKKKNYYIFS